MLVVLDVVVYIIGGSPDGLAALQPAGVHHVVPPVPGVGELGDVLETQGRLLAVVLLQWFLASIRPFRSFGSAGPQRSPPEYRESLRLQCSFNRIIIRQLIWNVSRGFHWFYHTNSNMCIITFVHMLHFYVLQ